MTIRSAAMIVNAQSRKGQAQFDEACAALEDLPFPVDAHAVHDPDTLDDIIKAALAKKPELMIIGGGDGTISGLERGRAACGEGVGQDVEILGGAAKINKKKND